MDCLVDLLFAKMLDCFGEFHLNCGNSIIEWYLNINI